MKAYKRMWILRRLKILGCSTADLLDVLKQQIISILEQAVPFWGPMLTQSESKTIERVFKAGLHIIFQDQYESFEKCLTQEKT